MSSAPIYEVAVEMYLAAVGPAASQPSRSLSTATNNAIYLRNVNGPLAVVTSTGKVFDRIGGKRLDKPATAGDIAERLARARKRTNSTHGLVWNEHNGRQVAAVWRYDRERDGDLVFVGTPEGWMKATQAGGGEPGIIAGMLHRELLQEHESS